MSDFIAANDAQVYWDFSGDYKVHNVRVVSRAVVLARQHDSDLGRYSGGAANAAWAKLPQPEAQFGEFLFHGFLNDHEMRKALVEFAKIDACGWARRMVGEELASGLNSIDESEALASRRAVDAQPVGARLINHFLTGKR